MPGSADRDLFSNIVHGALADLIRRFWQIFDNISMDSDFFLRNLFPVYALNRHHAGNGFYVAPIDFFSVLRRFDNRDNPIGQIARNSIRRGLFPDCS